MDLGLSLDISQPSAPDPVPSVEWEAWGEEATIELCEVQLGFDGSSISMDALFFNLNRSFHDFLQIFLQIHWLRYITLLDHN
jgi:hypothetical protein